MAGEVSCRALRPLFRYFHEYGFSLADLLADLPAGAADPTSPENWIAEPLFALLLERAVALTGDPDLMARVGEMAAEPCPFGPVSAEALLAGGPEALLNRAGDLLGLLQRGSRVEVPVCRPGEVIIEWFPPPGHTFSQALCTYARSMLAGIPRLWHQEGVRVLEPRCAVPPVALSLPSGSRCEVDAQGVVWEVSATPGAARSSLGRLTDDGTFRPGETVYGADSCRYEITWPVPAGIWRQALARLAPTTLLRPALFRLVQRQRRTIVDLRRQVADLNRRTEAYVLERTEALRLKARRMALVEQAGRRLAALLDPGALCQEVVHTLREELGYFTAALYLLEGGSWTLRALVSGDDRVQEQPGTSAGAPPAAVERLRRSSRPLLQEDLLRQPHSLGLPRLGRSCSALTAPLIASGRVLGVLEVQSPRPGRFSQDDFLILHMMGTQAAIALERSQAYSQEQRARQRADAMAMLARVINTTLDLEQVLSLALDQMRRVLPYDAAAILLLEAGQCLLAASDGLPPQAEAALVDLMDPRSRAPLSRTVQEGESLLVNATERTPDLLPPTLCALGSWLSVPLVSRGAVAGALVLAARRTQAYGPGDLHLAEDLASQVATAIANAGLYERIRRDRDQLEALYGIAAELNADLEIGEALQHILDLARASVGASAGSLILLDERGRPAHSIVGYPDHDSQFFLEEVLSRGAAGWVVRERKGLLIADTAADRRWLELPGDPRPMRSAAVVPLLAQDRVIGVLTVVHPETGHFGADDLELLTSVAGQASVVVQRARLFAAIRDERARLEAVIEGTADAVIVLDEGGRVLQLNRSAADLLAPGVEATRGDGRQEVLQHPALQPLLAMLDGGQERRRAEVPLPDGRTFYATLTPLAGVGVVITMQDITHLKELDRMKSDFVTSVSHDLRTPLAAVQGYAEMLEMAGPLSADQARFVERILHAVEGMSDLVEGLLDLTRIEAGVGMEMAPCHMAAIIAESVDKFSREAETKGVHLQVEVPEDLPLVRGNGRRLGQVVNNLLENAIKFTPGGGEVLLRAWAQPDGLRVEVCDSGPGIPPADLPRVFEKFYRARQGNAEVPGTGLGLSIAQSIVQAHGGRIWAGNNAGRGATLSFVLPLWE